MYFDTHTHANFDAFGAETPDVIKRALDQGVWLTNVGTSFETSKSCAELALKYPEGVYATIGVHPGHTWHEENDPDEGHHKQEKFDSNEFKKLLNEKVVAVGEIGLDYFRLPEDEAGCTAAKKLQKDAFIEQLSFASENHLPIVIHCRDAYEDTLDIIKSEYKGSGILHSFTGEWSTAKQFLDLGFYIALNGILTFDKTGRLAEVCKNVPEQMLLSETDAPYLAPPPYRGKRNEPSYVKYIVEYMAKLRNVDQEKFSDITFQNALKVYGLKK